MQNIEERKISYGDVPWVKNVALRQLRYTESQYLFLMRTSVYPVPDHVGYDVIDEGGHRRRVFDRTKPAFYKHQEIYQPPQVFRSEAR